MNKNQTSPATPTVVVGYADRHTSGEAIGWALDHARRHAMPVHLVHCLDWGGRGSLGDGPQLVGDELREVLAELGADASGVEVTASVVRGDVVRRLSSMAASGNLLVLGSRGRPGWLALLGGGSSVQVTANAPGTVVVVPPEPVPAPGGPVVVAVEDADEVPGPLVETARELATARQVPLRLVHITVAPPARQRMSGPAGTPAVEEVVGLPVAALRAEARRSSLLVIGASPRSTIGGLATGSVALGLAGTTACPLVVVGPGS